MTPLMYGGFGAMKAMCTKYNDDPKKASRPFDADRAGFVMGEGAGVVVLENADHAAKRGARVYAELAGYGATCDAHHITTPAPEGAGLAKCLTKALESAGIAPSEVAYVNAHGTSTAYNDKFETMALKTVFGDHAYDLAVSSTKGATGHTLGAAGGIEAVLTCLAVARDTCPPTINLETPDPDCDLDYVANRVAIKRDQVASSPWTARPPDGSASWPRRRCDPVYRDRRPFSGPGHMVVSTQVAKGVSHRAVDVAITENLGFGGHNGALVFKKAAA